MAVVDLKCKNCTGQIALDASGKRGTCSYCRAEYIIQDRNNYHIVNNNYVSADGMSAKTLTERGEDLLAERDFAEAKKRFVRALDISPKYARAFFGMARVEAKAVKREEYIGVVVQNWQNRKLTKDLYTAHRYATETTRPYYFGVIQDIHRKGLALRDSKKQAVEDACGKMKKWAIIDAIIAVAFTCLCVFASPWFLMLLFMYIVAAAFLKLREDITVPPLMSAKIAKDKAQQSYEDCCKWVAEVERAMK